MRTTQKVKSNLTLNLSSRYLKVTLPSKVTSRDAFPLMFFGAAPRSWAGSCLGYVGGPQLGMPLDREHNEAMIHDSAT